MFADGPGQDLRAANNAHHDTCTQAPPLRQMTITATSMGSPASKTSSGSSSHDAACVLSCSLHVLHMLCNATSSARQEASAGTQLTRAMVLQLRQPNDASLAFLLGLALGVMATLSIVELWVANALENGVFPITAATLAGAGLYYIAQPYFPDFEVRC